MCGHSAMKSATMGEFNATIKQSINDTTTTTMFKKTDKKEKMLLTFETAHCV